MADSSAGLTVRLPWGWLNVKHAREYRLQGRVFVSWLSTVQAIMSGDHQWILGAHGVTEKVGYITYVDQLDAYYESARGNFSVAFFSK